jgi:hypothetical protein
VRILAAAVAHTVFREDSTRDRTGIELVPSSIAGALEQQGLDPKAQNASAREQREVDRLAGENRFEEALNTLEGVLVRPAVSQSIRDSHARISVIVHPLRDLRNQNRLTSTAQT